MVDSRAVLRTDYSSLSQNHYGPPQVPSVVDISALNQLPLAYSRLVPFLNNAFVGLRSLLQSSKDN